MNGKDEKKVKRMNACEAPTVLFFMCPVCGLKYSKKEGEARICPHCKGKKE
jgi:rubrerythrin